MLRTCESKLNAKPAVLAGYSGGGGGERPAGYRTGGRGGYGGGGSGGARGGYSGGRGGSGARGRQFRPRSTFEQYG